MQFRLVEMFESVQGEGLQSGRLATFIRLAGCNLRCSWCDTSDSWLQEKHQEISLLQLLAEVENIAHSNFIVITGGEPLLYDLSALSLQLRKKGYFIAVETNGTLPLAGKVDWLTVSPKPPIYKINEQLYEKISELKLVVDDSLTFTQVQKFQQKVGKDIPIILQPESCRKEKLEVILNWLKEEPSWRLGIQLHKLIGVE